jgi:hypothetical protein
MTGYVGLGFMRVAAFNLALVLLEANPRCLSLGDKSGANCTNGSNACRHRAESKITLFFDGRPIQLRSALLS